MKIGGSIWKPTFEMLGNAWKYSLGSFAAGTSGFVCFQVLDATEYLTGTWWGHHFSSR